jgi:hypothetical protein
MIKNRDIQLEEEKPHTETQYMRERPVRESKKREKNKTKRTTSRTTLGKVVEVPNP